MLLYIFVGSLLPCIQGLDSWLFEGILNDPFEEVFYAFDIYLISRKLLKFNFVKLA